MSLLPFALTTVSGLSNSLFCFSGNAASKQGFPVVPRQINYTGGKNKKIQKVLRANGDFMLYMPELNVLEF